MRPNENSVVCCRMQLLCTIGNNLFVIKKKSENGQGVFSSTEPTK